MPTAILPPENHAWGFYGTIERAGFLPDSAWTYAFEAVLDATGCEPAHVRAFLDSRFGRHFADAVANEAHGPVAAPRARLQHAVRAAARRWQAWRIDWRTAGQHGIPQGLPYLTGWVTRTGILAEAEA